METPVEPGLGSRILARVQEGMKVFDPAGRQVGTVEHVYLGSADERSIAQGTGPATVEDPHQGDHSFLDDLGRAFARDELPETLRARLLLQGFIRVDGAGLLATDRYLTPSQIARVGTDEVRLKVDWKRLPAAS